MTSGSSIMSYLDTKSQDRYVRWVNRVLARAEKPYKLCSLKDDVIRNGRVLYDVVEHLSGSPVPGFIHIESRRAVLHNLQLLLNHVAALKIRMSLIQAADIERGDLLAVLRFLLGIVRHYEPHRIRYKVNRHRSQTPVSSLCSSQSSHRPQTPHTRNARLVDKRETIATDLLPSKCSPRRSRNEVHRQPCSDTSANNVQVTDNRVRRFSDSSSSGTHSLPRDILEIHMKLKELKQLLSRPDIVSDSVEKRDKCCQTSSSALQESHDRTLRQKDSFIAHQKDQMTKLRAFLERRTKLTECLSKELSVLKSSSQQSRRACIDPTESRILDQFVTLLKSIRSDISLRQSDLDRFDEGLSLLNALLSSSRHQVVDKANVAVVTPCANSTRDEPCPPSQAISNQRNTLSQYNARREESHTKMMVYFQGNSLNPYQSVIPLPLSRITLLDVKQSTKSLLSNDVKFRYFFNTINSDFGPTKQEISADEDKVPGINGKIIVFIQQ